uniref:Uncharacterized protein n=1 Tax=Acrobeloides nanus TaxID=290746 RepID=A0A914C618_9BILA
MLEVWPDDAIGELVQHWTTLKIRGEVETNAELMDYLDVDDQLTTADESDPLEKDIVDRHSQVEETLEHEPLEYATMENELLFEADSLVNEPEDYSAFEYLIDEFYR